MFIKQLFLASALVLMPLAAHAQATTPIAQLPAGAYGLDKTHASLTWKVMHLGLANYTARFTDFDADLHLDPANVTNSKVSVTINPASVRTDYPHADKKDFDAKLAKGAEWFNADKFPQITFTSTSLTQTGERTGKLTGDLTFLGVTKPVTLDVTFNGGMAAHPFTQKAAVGFSATGTLKRSEWGFTTYIPNIGDEVALMIEVEFLKKD
jgi:polyisoprenoid-binding protein YceI